MKAIIYRTVFAYIAAIVILVAFTAVIMQALGIWKTGSAEQNERLTFYKPYSFDINDLIVDPDDDDVFDADMQNGFYSGDDSAFCQNLRSCIEMNLKGGSRCVISYEVKPGTVFSIESFKNALNSCKPTIITDDLYGKKTHRKVCTFNPITKYNELREDNASIIEYEPYLHNCYLPDNLGSFNVLGDTDSINYLYSGRGTADGYDFENGGTVRIVVTNVSLHDDFEGTCSYSMYVCGQNAIAVNETETSIQVFKKIQYLEERELYYNETLVWAGTDEVNRKDSFCWYLCLSYWGATVGNVPLIGGFLRAFASISCVLCGPVDIFTAGYNIYGYNPRYYEFSFNSGLPDKKLALIDAIDAGMWEWNKVHYNDQSQTKYFRNEYYSGIKNAYFSYSPIVNISEDNTLSYDTGCWNTDYENSDVEERTFLNMSKPNGVLTNSPSLYHIFKFNGPISENIKMTLGIKKMFITGKEYYFNNEATSILKKVNENYNPDLDMDSRAILVMDPITFCGE